MSNEYRRIEVITARPVAGIGQPNRNFRSSRRAFRQERWFPPRPGGTALRQTCFIDGADCSVREVQRPWTQMNLSSAPPRSKSLRIVSASWNACSAARRWKPRSSERLLTKPTPKNGSCGQSYCRRTVQDEGRSRCSGRFALESRRAFERPVEAARSYRQAADADVLPLIRGFVGERPSYGYRRIAGLLNRERRADIQSINLQAPVNAKRVHGIMGQHATLLTKRTAMHKGRVHDGRGMVMRSNLRWCSDGLEFTCWNGEVVRMAFSSTPSTARLSPGAPLRMPAYLAPTSAT